MKRIKVLPILCLSLVCGGIALAYEPFLVPVCCPLLAIKACPQFWLGKQIFVFGKLYPMPALHMLGGSIAYPYNYVLKSAITGVEIGVKIDDTVLYSAQRRGVPVAIAGTIRQGWMKSTFLVPILEYYIEPIATTVFTN